MTRQAPRRVHVARAVRSTPLHLVLLIISAVWLLPVVGLLVSSFRPGSDVATSGWWESFASPGSYTLDNYARVLERNGLLLSIFNSLAIAVPATVATVAVASLAAYGLTRVQFRARRPMLLIIVALLVVPSQITLVPLLGLFDGWGLAGTFPGVWLIHLGYSLPFAIYLLQSFFAGVPTEIFEAAALDGAHHGEIFLQVVLPISRPALASLAIFEFVWNWNDLLTALIFLGGDRDIAPLTVAVSTMVASRGEGWQVLTSAAIVSMIVPLIVFLAAQRQFERGILAGATKG